LGRLLQKREGEHVHLSIFNPGADVFIYILLGQLMPGGRQLKIGGFVYDTGLSLQH
jgi:hypothetical protein